MDQPNPKYPRNAVFCQPVSAERATYQSGADPTGEVQQIAGRHTELSLILDDGTGATTASEPEEDFADQVLTATVELCDGDDDHYDADAFDADIEEDDAWLYSSDEVELPEDDGPSRESSPYRIKVTRSDRSSVLNKPERRIVLRSPYRSPKPRIYSTQFTLGRAESVRGKRISASEQQIESSRRVMAQLLKERAAAVAAKVAKEPALASQGFEPEPKEGSAAIPADAPSLQPDKTKIALFSSDLGSQCKAEGIAHAHQSVESSDVANQLDVDAPLQHLQSFNAAKVEGEFSPYKLGAFVVGENYLAYEHDKGTVQITATRVHVAFACSADDGKGHGFCLTWLNRNGEVCSKMITMRRLVSDWLALLGELADEGLIVLSIRHFKEYLLAACSRAQLPEVRLITHIGFFPLNPEEPEGVYGFMLPSGAILPKSPGQVCINANALRYRAPFEHKALGAYQVAGTHDNWKAGLAPAEKNVLVVFCTCAVLGSIMLKVYGGENCGFHLYGLSSTGKSTAAQVGMSVLGCAADPQSSSKPTIFGSWAATDNGREIMAACASGGALMMDELDSSPKGASLTIYPLMNGVGKARMQSAGSMASQSYWRLLVLSTGELSLAERIEREPQREVMLGELSRFLDIPVDNLPRDESLTVEQAQALASQLKQQSGELYGSACVAFVRQLFDHYSTQSELRAALLEAIDIAHAELCARLAPRRHLRSAHKRAIRHFALVLAVGRWAADGVLPFSVASVERAVFAVADAWCDGFPSLTDEDRVMDSFRTYLREQRDSVVCTATATEAEQRGRVPKILLHDGRLYMAPECFHQACGELPMVKVGKILDRLDILHRHSNEGQKVKMTVWPSLFRNQRYYALDASRLLCEQDLTELMRGVGGHASAVSYEPNDLEEISRL